MKTVKELFNRKNATFVKLKYIETEYPYIIDWVNKNSNLGVEIKIANIKSFGGDDSTSWYSMDATGGEKSIVMAFDDISDATYFKIKFSA